MPNSSNFFFALVILDKKYCIRFDLLKFLILDFKSHSILAILKDLYSPEIYKRAKDIDPVHREQPLIASNLEWCLVVEKAIPTDDITSQKKLIHLDYTVSQF